MLEDPSVATRWRNLVNSTQDKWAHEDKSGESDEGSSDGSDGGVLFERDTKAIGVSDRILRALAGFFTARAWKPRTKGAAQTNPTYSEDTVRESIRGLSTWKGYRSSGDMGSSHISNEEEF
jgi:hypothetical protein